ncbi:MAG: AAA family ATPase, partial [Ruthenibacterium sp.]
MLLTALEIQGFKSFPDRTKILIGKGITAVVGPNGSGKSNISDAIRWVLGETSAKQLRGGGKMENVIFGGTQQRGAMGYAMVNLYVDNTDRRLEVDSNEVVIGRKYYRSGDSEYSINGQNVRLKDVYELFLDTGIGRDGYSIIGQGRIAEIVGAKSNERREIFEEASGIARFRYRKNEAERRLAGAEDNLVRLRDILGELESRVGPLEKDAKKAKQFLDASARRKEMEVTLWVDTVRKAKDILREKQRNIDLASADYQKTSDEIDEIDASTAEIRTEIERMIMDSDRVNGEIRSIVEGISGADAQIAVLRNDMAHHNNTIASLEADIAQSSAGCEN